MKRSERCCSSDSGQYVDAAVFVCCLCEVACGCAGGAAAPWFSGVVILSADPGRAVYFRPSPCEWRSNQAWDGLSGLSGWGMRGDGNQRHRAGPNHDGRTWARQPHRRGRARWKKWGETQRNWKYMLVEAEIEGEETKQSKLRTVEGKDRPLNTKQEVL